MKPKKKIGQKRYGRPLEQVAALPFRFSPEGYLEILLITSRSTRRAVIPKGWPMKGVNDWKAAEIEARQEAGVAGQVASKPVGRYSYWKRMAEHFTLVIVTVYPLAVDRQLKNWSEKGQRERLWVQPEQAAMMIDEPNLGTLITNFAAGQHLKT